MAFDPDVAPPVPPTITKAAALKRLEALGIDADARLYIQKRGRWDARYDVIAIVPAGKS